VEHGTPVLEVAKSLGIHIPTVCYHEALKPYGACRLCIVEAIRDNRSKLVTSCNYPAEEGLVVLTDSEEVKETRKGLMELLLARCPDVPQVRQLAEEMGVKATSIKMKENQGCVLCGLCVRWCEEIVGVSAIGFTDRGIEREVNTPFGLDSDVCIDCGACTYICPTSCIGGVHLDQEQCIRCEACVKVCPVEVPTVKADGKVDVDIFHCQACGTCVAECPVQAVNVRLCPHGRILSEVESTLGQSQIAEPFVVGMFSQYGNFTTSHLDDLGRDFPQIVPIMTFGLEKVSVSDLLRIFQMGVDAILLGEAPAEKRPFSETQPLVQKRSQAVGQILELLGLGGDRLISYTMPQDGLFEAPALAEMMDKIKTLGPNPLRMVSSPSPSVGRGKKMGDLTLNICRNNHDCETCRIDKEFLEGMGRVMEGVRIRRQNNIMKQSSSF
jgi:ferredoxin